MKRNKPLHNSVVAKHNDLIPQMSQFQLPELRLIAYCLAHYDSRKPQNRTFKARVDELAKIFPSMGEKTAYDVIKKTMLEISKKPLVFQKGNKKYYWNWFSGFVYTEGKGEFEFKITPEIQPYLLELKKQFSEYRLLYVYQFKTAFTWKLYENLNQWKKAGVWYIEIEVFKELLGVSGKYIRFNSFKEKVIEPALKELNQKSDLVASYEKETKSRKVVALKFFIDKKLNEELENIEDPKSRLLKLLLICGVSTTASNNYVKKICSIDQEDHFIKKLPLIKKRWDTSKGALPKYVSGAINRELEELETVEDNKPDHSEALACWHSKKMKKETCSVRERGKAGNRKKCQICLDKIAVNVFGL
ncbi:MAG: RepB family plasmid replication initiator protein [Candidatus Electrothrix sp. GM3_4]|nr:RepB family plasmid replication initiator protein [Candidatus Electrothrix sp. GM3_4]